jgi:hypothetical protein
MLWPILGLTFFIIGIQILHSIKLQVYLHRAEDQVFVAMWIGIIDFSNMLLLVSLFIPLTAYIGMAIAVVLIIPYLLRKRESATRQTFITGSTVFGLVIVTLALAFFTAVGPIEWYDTGLYHYQLVRWLSEYGSVPGLALIHERFGFTSTWFALIASLQVGPIKNHLATVVNGFIFCLMTLQMIVALGKVYERRAKEND